MLWETRKELEALLERKWLRTSVDDAKAAIAERQAELAQLETDAETTLRDVAAAIANDRPDSDESEREARVEIARAGNIHHELRRLAADIRDEG